MGVIPRSGPYFAPAVAVRHDGKPALDRPGAALFLQAQSSWARRGLLCVEEPAAAGIVLGAHDGSHESWLMLIAALRDVDAAAADAVSALYGYHGRVAGLLERGPDRRLEPDVRARVRALLAVRLHELTAEALRALARAPIGPAARHLA